MILGTNHVDPWLDGIGVWPDGAWATPLGDVAIDDDLAADVVSLGAPFHAGRAAHAGEHSIEVQLPLLQAVAAGARIVPLAVSAGRGAAAVDAGRALGGLLAARARAGHPTVLAISTDMAHYPSSAAARAVTEALLPALTAIDPVALAAAEAAGVARGRPWARVRHVRHRAGRPRARGAPGARRVGRDIAPRRDLG